uniref:Uncharacterized protein n=1 Tax=Kwoniella bestiolae CBS 10118 TaxID=1296100 RepID=A0A1B9G2V1_9TREE|nr:hypothetical protein I302_05163 [Kwoniella bestiolae CBS 10118]OCF25346.1 hypothetical protein I302_05163 [Kwoniella bestiolae CBS 10118]
MFPPKPHQLSLLLDVLIRLNIRFILVQGVAPPELQKLARDKIQGSDYADKAMLIQWANQYGVLSHEGTGWFLTHGGSNSTMEGLRTRTPMYQVWISSSLSQSHKVGYEFIQIRNGPNIGKVTARTPNTVVEGTNEAIEKEFMDVFGNLNNDFGDEIRRNVERVGDEVDDDEIAREGWKEIMGL